MIHDCFLFCDGCSRVPCLFWTVKRSSFLQKNPPCPAESSIFQHHLHIWTLSSSDCIILRSIFSHWGQLRDSNTTIKKGSNTHWCSRRKCDGLKGQFAQKFTPPQVVPNLYECLCSAEHKGRYFEECGKQSSSGTPLTSIVFFFILWKSMMPQNSLVTNFLQNIFLCVRQNKVHTGLELLEGE